MLTMNRKHITMHPSNPNVPRWLCLPCVYSLFLTKLPVSALLRYGSGQNVGCWTETLIPCHSFECVNSWYALNNLEKI